MLSRGTQRVVKHVVTELDERAGTMRALGLLLCLLAPARAQHSNSPLFVFVHVVKTGGTALRVITDYKRAPFSILTQVVSWDLVR